MRGWRPWAVQPPVGTPIDWDSPLAAGLRFWYFPPGFSGGIDLVQGLLGASITTPLAQIATANGISDEFNASGSIAFTRDTFLEPASNLTWMSFQRRSGTQANENTPILCKTYQNNANSPYISYQTNSYYSIIGTQDAVSIGVAAGGTLYQTGVTAPISTLIPFMLLGTYDGSELDMYFNGAFSASTGATGSITYDTTSSGNLMIGSASSAGSTKSFLGEVYSAAMWARVLSDAEIASLYFSPWQIFHRRRRAYSLITSSTISASISEAVTSSDAYALSATAAAAITAAATSSDAYALAATVPSAISEEIYPSDAYALAVTIAAALDSSAAASSALSAVATIAATIADVSSAQDTLGVTATVLAAIAEAATATDTQVTGSVTSAEYAESATAAAIFSATVSIAATLTEAGLAADQIAAMATVAADLAESGAASDAYLRSVLLAVELLENAAAADELSAAAFEQIIDAAKTIITILQAQDTVTMVQARDTLRILQ